MAQQMPNPIELYEAAAEGFRQTLSGISANQMNSPTPCSEWSVQALINHNINTAAFAHGVLQGNVTVHPMEVSGPLPAEGAVASLDAGVARVLELVKSSGSLDEQIETPFGTMPRGHFLMLPFSDLLIHKWDLAKGTGQSTALDSGLVEACYAALAPQMEGMRAADAGGAHFFGPEVSVPATASAQDKLMGITGRRP